MTSPEAAPAFDTALIEIAEFLADARHLERHGRGERAAAVYALAEERALVSGFLELVHLVWAYTPAAAGSARD